MSRINKIEILFLITTFVYSFALHTAANSIFNLRDIAPDPHNKIQKKLTTLILKNPHAYIQNPQGEICYDTRPSNIQSELLSLRKKADRFMQHLCVEHRCNPNDRAEDITNTHIIVLNKIIEHKKLTSTLKIAALLRCKLDYRDYFLTHLDKEITFLQNQGNQPEYLQNLQKLVTYVHDNLIPRTDELITILESNRDYSHAFKQLFKE